MYKQKKIYAVYRLLYGEDFIKESIESILKYVDKIFIFWSDYPFHKVKGVNYNGEYIRFPNKFDNSIEIIKSIDSDKIVLVNEHFETNTNSFTKMYNEHILVEYDECDILMMIEVDHVFREDQLVLALDEFIDSDLPAATTEQWEIWKGFNHCVPQWNDPVVKISFPENIINSKNYKNIVDFYSQQNPRKRMCTMFLDMNYYGMLPPTGMHCNPLNIPFHHNKYRLKARTHNFGFAKSYKIMRWAHLIAVAVSHLNGDTVGNEDWLDEKWVNWTSEMENLEGCIGYEWHIPRCVPYPYEELPESIKKITDKIRYKS